LVKKKVLFFIVWLIIIFHPLVVVAQSVDLPRPSRPSHFSIGLGPIPQTQPLASTLPDGKEEAVRQASEAARLAFSPQSPTALIPSSPPMEAKMPIGSWGTGPKPQIGSASSQIPLMTYSLAYPMLLSTSLAVEDASSRQAHYQQVQQFDLPKAESMLSAPMVGYVFTPPAPSPSRGEPIPSAPFPSSPYVSPSPQPIFPYPPLSAPTPFPAASPSQPIFPASQPIFPAVDVSPWTVAAALPIGSAYLSPRPSFWPGPAFGVTSSLGFAPPYRYASYGYGFPAAGYGFPAFSPYPLPPQPPPYLFPPFPFCPVW